MHPRNLILYVLLGITFTVYAQDVSYPPDPAEIFSPDVEIVETRQLFAPVFDNDRRDIRIFDSTTDEWHSYPYPASLQSVSRLYEMNDDTLLTTAPWEYSPENTWVLDPGTGQYRRPASSCGQLRAAQGEGEWVWFTDADGKVRACFTETGELHAPLPDDLAWVADPYPRDAELSPDGEYVVYLEFQPEPQDTATVWAYNIDQQEGYPLGVIDYLYDETYLERWLDQTHIVVSNGDMPETSAHEIYVADVTQTNSLQYVLPRITNGWNEPRLEYLTTTGFLQWKYGVKLPEHEPCQLQFYEPDTGLRKFELGYDCAYANAIRVGDSYYYVRIDGPDAQLSSLVRLDLQSERFFDLYIAEIETLESISPDGRYAALGVHDNGRIDLVDFFDSIENWKPPSVDGIHLEIVDLETGTPVYSVADLGSVNSYTWLGDHQLFMGLGKVDREPPHFPVVINGSVRLITFKSSGYTEKAVTGSVAFADAELSPDQSHALIKTPLMVADFDDLKLYSVLSPTGNSQQRYDLSSHWRGDHTLIVTISPKIDKLQSFEYALSLP